MRGKLLLLADPNSKARNIPAYAGKTRHQGRRHRKGPEHPRVCGENPVTCAQSCSGRGTSPRMRGKLSIAEPFGWGKRNIPAYAGKPHPHVGLVLGVRNIPAYAGKTIAGTYIWRPLAEHPRVCGENADNVVMPVFNAGTSPRARGKRPKAHRGRLVGRNIPACAGKTSMVGVSGAWVTEHPRVRGENSICSGIVLYNRGTSPRARGKPRWLA